MPIGALKKRITIQSPTAVADGMGGETVTFSAVSEVWAGIWPISAKEQIQGAEPTMEITHRIRLRYRAFEPDWRIKFGERYFAVTSIVNPNEQNRWLDLLCKEVKS